MAALDNELAEIERLLRNVRVSEAEQRLRGLLVSMGAEQLRAWEKELRSLIDQFLPKRRRALTAGLDEGLQQSMGAPDRAESPPKRVDQATGSAAGRTPRGAVPPTTVRRFRSKKETGPRLQPTWCTASRTTCEI